MHNEKFMLSDLPDYYIGEEGDLKHYKEVRKYVCFPHQHSNGFRSHLSRVNLHAFHL